MPAGSSVLILEPTGIGSFGSPTIPDLIGLDSRLCVPPLPVVCLCHWYPKQSMADGLGICQGWQERNLPCAKKIGDERNRGDAGGFTAQDVRAQRETAGTVSDRLLDFRGSKIPFGTDEKKGLAAVTREDL